MSEQVHERGATGTRTTIFACFDGLRAIGATMVLAHHVGNNTGDLQQPFWGTILARFEVSLAILFMVSGFLLFRPLVAAGFAGRTPSTANYFRRRFFRIFPGYWLALVVIWFVFSDFHAPGLTSPLDFLWYSSLAYTYTDEHVFAPIQQAWTLNIELAFYFFMPALVYLVHRFGRGARERFRAHLVGLVAVFVAHQAFVAWVFTGPQERWQQRLWWLPGYLGAISFGMLLAVLSAGHEAGLFRLPSWTLARHMPLLAWGGAAALFAVLSFAFGLPNNRYDYSAGQWELVNFANIAIAVLLLLPAVFGPQDEGPVRRFLRWRPMAFTGLVSYGVYLWHIAWIGRYYEWTGAERHAGGYFPLLAWTLGLSIAAGALSFYLVERPAQRLAGSRAVNRGVGAPGAAPAP